MAIQTKYQKDLQDGKIKPKPVVKAPVVNTVRPSLPTAPAAPKAPAGNPYQNIYAAPKAPVYSSDRGADRIKALAPAPVKYTPQNLPVYRGAPPAVQPQAQLVKPQQQGGLPVNPLQGARSAAQASVAANGTGNMQYSQMSGATTPPPAWGNPKNQDMAGAGKTPDSWYTASPPAPKAFDSNNATLQQIGLQIAALTGVAGQEKEVARLTEIYKIRYNLQLDAKNLAPVPGAPVAQTDYALTAEGQAAANAAQVQLFNLQTAATTASAQQAQSYAMAQLNANNAAAERMAQMQYAQTPPVDRTEYNQMVDMYQALQQQMMTLQNSYIQALRDRDIPVVAPVVPPPVTGPTPFVPPSFAPSPQTGAYAEFSDTGLGALNTMNPSNLQVLRQLMQARGYTGAGSQGRYGERTYARPGGSGALGISDADFENPLNYAGVAAADRENAEAAMRWFLGQSGYSPQYAFPGMPSYPGGGTFIDLPRIS